MYTLGYRKSSVEFDPITISSDERFQHTYVIGQTGTGKSTFAKNTFLQDVYHGHGACYFDFHGQDAPWLLDYIPKERLNDVVYIDPLDPSHALGYNVLDGVRPEDFATFTDEIVASLRHIHSASWGPRMDDILTNSIRPLFDLPPESQGTMVGVVRILTDPYYRNWVVGQCSEQTVRDFWLTEYAGWSKNDRAGHLNSSLNKLRRFQSSPILRNIIGQQRSRVNFARAIDQGQIIILNLNKWRMGAVNAGTLAALILSRIIYEATRRPIPMRNGQPADELLKPFHVVVDEFQSVTSLSTAEALSGIRKYKTSFTLCHQYTDQLSPEVLSAIKGNVGTKIVFRVGGDDARTLQRNLDITEPKQLTQLADFEFHAQFKSEHAVTTRHGFTTPMDWGVCGYSQAIRNTMRAKFALPVVQVQEKYERWVASRHYGGTVSRPKVKRKNGTKHSHNRGTRINNGMRSLSQIISS